MVVVPIFNKGDQKKCSNYRGITPFSLVEEAFFQDAGKDDLFTFAEEVLSDGSSRLHVCFVNNNVPHETLYCRVTVGVGVTRTVAMSHLVLV